MSVRRRSLFLPQHLVKRGTASTSNPTLQPRTLTSPNSALNITAFSSLDVFLSVFGARKRNTGRRWPLQRLAVALLIRSVSGHSWFAQDPIRPRVVLGVSQWPPVWPCRPCRHLGCRCTFCVYLPLLL